MLKKAMKLILGVFCALIGLNLVQIWGVATDLSNTNFLDNPNNYIISTQTLGIIIGFLAGFFIISYLIEKLLQVIINFEGKIKEITFKSLVIRTTGIFIGLLFGLLVNNAITYQIISGANLKETVGTLVSLIFVYLGFSLFSYKEKEISNIFNNNYNKNNKDNIYDGYISNKILDTSVIIDGRIADICKSGFVEGTLIIPEFVLEELRHIADSSDVLKRNRGRRGLDILKQMQKEPGIDVEIINQDFDELQEVDSKLVKLAQVIDARVITNDYNLNKVAELQGVFVLNINELANAVKPVVLPGEEMDVKVIKEGKEDGQGVAYLDDGTMIVVDDGVKYMGKKISVLVTSILQTAAGRMIFAKPKAREQIV